MLKIYSNGILKIPALDMFIDPENRQYETKDAIAGWGHKHTAIYARDKAKHQNLPYIALEDGFIRSLNLGLMDCAAFSISVDPIGCYYDAFTPSLIEESLTHYKEWFTEELKLQAQELRRAIVENNISKYNLGIDLGGDVLGNESIEDRVLIVDQTANDASVSLGMSSYNAMEQMILWALKEYPSAYIYIKVHPDVLTGLKQGLFTKEHLKLSDKIRVLTGNAETYTLLKQFKVLFTATSQFGFEALLAGLKVYCVGLPFYAGYGLTTDLKKIPRRNELKGITIEMLVAASLIKLCRYANPITAKKITPIDTIAHLKFQKNIYKQLNKNFKSLMLGLSENEIKIAKILFPKIKELNLETLNVLNSCFANTKVCINKNDTVVKLTDKLQKFFYNSYFISLTNLEKRSFQGKLSQLVTNMSALTKSADNSFITHQVIISPIIKQCILDVINNTAESELKLAINIKENLKILTELSYQFTSKNILVFNDIFKNCNVKLSKFHAIPNNQKNKLWHKNKSEKSESYFSQNIGAGIYFTDLDNDYVLINSELNRDSNNKILNKGFIVPFYDLLKCKPQKESSLYNFSKTLTGFEVEDEKLLDELLVNWQEIKKIEQGLLTYNLSKNDNQQLVNNCDSTTELSIEAIFNIWLHNVVIGVSTKCKCTCYINDLLQDLKNQLENSTLKVKHSESKYQHIVIYFYNFTKKLFRLNNGY